MLWVGVDFSRSALEYIGGNTPHDTDLVGLLPLFVGDEFRAGFGGISDVFVSISVLAGV